jgi:hypothetical protein
MSGFRLCVVVAMLAASAAGCAKAHARTEPVMPELTPPPPPPRLVEQYIDEPVPTIDPSPAENALSVPPARTTAKPPAPRPETAAVKPEPPPAIEPPRPATPPSLTLKPAPGTPSATEASIRGLLGRASRDLGRVNYSALTSDGKAQYDTARRFIQQSEEGLRNGNLVYAGKLADKAATMASVLVR